MHKTGIKQKRWTEHEVNMLIDYIQNTPKKELDYVSYAKKAGVTRNSLYKKVTRLFRDGKIKIPYYTPPPQPEVKPKSEGERLHSVFAKRKSLKQSKVYTFEPKHDFSNLLLPVDKLGKEKAIRISLQSIRKLRKQNQGK